jgi:hypothetical protein
MIEQFAKDAQAKVHGDVQQPAIAKAEATTSPLAKELDLLGFNAPPHSVKEELQTVGDGSSPLVSAMRSAGLPIVEHDFEQGKEHVDIPKQNG